MTVDDGNGKKIAVHEVEIQQLSDGIAELTKLMNDIFGPNGMCYKRHKEIDDGAHDREKKIMVNQNQTNWQWVAIAGIGAGEIWLYKLIVDMLRQFNG